MKTISQLSLAAMITLFSSGCSEKSFTLQSYADRYFNDKNSTQEIEAEQKTTESEAVQKIKESTYIDDATTNTALKSGPGAKIAPSSTYQRDEKQGGEGALQKSLDEWTKKEWEPTFKGDEEQAQKDAQANEHFTMQHYVDKIDKYLEAKEANRTEPKEPAHYEKMESLPVIGK